MKRLFVAFFLVGFTLLTHASPPKAEQVFPLSARVVDPNTLSLEWNIKPGFFLYRDRIHLSPGLASETHLDEIRFPTPLTKTDRRGMSIPIYRNTLRIPVTLLAQQPGDMLIPLSYQGCADDGFCYPPQTKELLLTINDKLELVHIAVETPTKSTKLTNVEPQSIQPIDRLFFTKHWSLVFLSFFGFGLLLAFTPCVLPMIPVLSGIIMGQGKRLSTHNAFLLSLSYVISMAVTYSIIGATVALIGNNLQVSMQNPWVIITYGFIFVLLSLSMFGFYDLKLPNAWQSKLTKWSHGHAKGHYVGAAIMGCLSTLILSPCVTAPLIGALSYIAQTGDIIRGSGALFFMGLGMGTPLLIIGTTEGTLLPKTGEWMNTIKTFFGFILLGVALYLISRVLAAPIMMDLWACFLIFTGIYVGALTHAHTNQAKFQQGVGIITFSYGILILIGASQGNTNPLQPLVHTASIPKSHVMPIETQTLPAIQSAIAESKGKPVILDFYADWCASCQIIENTTLQNPQVIQALANTTFIKVDLTRNDNESRAIMNAFQVVAPPTFLFINAEGDEVISLRLVGDISAQELLKAIRSRDLER